MLQGAGQNGGYGGTMAGVSISEKVEAAVRVPSTLLPERMSTVRHVSVCGHSAFRKRPIERAHRSRYRLPRNR